MLHYIAVVQGRKLLFEKGVAGNFCNKCGFHISLIFMSTWLNSAGIEQALKIFLIVCYVNHRVMIFREFKEFNCISNSKVILGNMTNSG